MSFSHGRLAYVSVAGTDLSAYFSSTDLPIDVENADTTTFGNAWHTNIAGLAGATFSLSGYWDPTASTGPAAVLVAAIATCQGGTPVACVFRPAGTGGGKATRTFNANITGYTEGAEVGGVVPISATFQVTGAVTFATQ